jgi:hypothetical protein
MALTVSLNRPTVFGDAKVASGTITFDSSYPTNGESLTAADLALSQVDVFIPAGPARDANGAVAVDYDHANSKVKAYWVDTTVDGAEQAEVVNTTNLSGYSFRFVALGR